MLGAIAGDIIGSIYERASVKHTDFPLFQRKSTFTDDTVMTIAVADALLHKDSFEPYLKKWGRKYPFAGYGGRFRQWLAGIIQGPYNSWGNGSAMRVSPVSYVGNSLEEVMELAAQSAMPTHNHPEGIKGAQATATAIYLARQGKSKDAIREHIESFGYHMDRTIDEIRPTYQFDVSCAGSVPESILAFLESDSFESAVRLAISLGGDADTMASIAGAIAEAHDGIPPEIQQEVRRRIPAPMLEVLDSFSTKYC